MNKTLRTLILFSLGALLVCPMPQAMAQAIKGVYTNRPVETKKGDEPARPIPKIFSSQLRSIKQAEKVDALYNNLFVTLYNSMNLGTTYKAKLMEHMQLEKFQLTRYPKEFKGDMDTSMQSLNQAYKDMEKQLQDADAQVKTLREGIAPDEQEKYDRLWTEKRAEFKKKSEAYFKSQHTFLNTYNTLVKFILKNAGSYYYDSKTKGIKFVKFEGYKYFGSSIDALNKISHQQNIMMKEIVSSVDPAYAP